jgi:guanylate kinase
MKRKGAFPLVIAAPSGAGKTSLARALVERREDVVFSLSATTRAARPGEQQDVDYHFVDDHGFQRLIDTGELLEWAEVHGRRYGTLRRGVETALARDCTVVLDIDVQGARRIRAALPAAVLVFILPPSVAEMRRRLEQRGSGENAAELERRMLTARAELNAVKEFDYVVINDDFDESIRVLESIMTAERRRCARLGGLEDMLSTLRRDMDGLLNGSK